jgi:hypothetical protein
MLGEVQSIAARGHCWLLAELSPLPVAPRREFAPAWRPTFFAGAKRVGKETPNTSLFERRWLNHLTPLQRVVRLGATSIHGDVKGLFFRQHFPSLTVVPDFAGMTKTGVPTKREVMSRRDQPQTWPERQWPLAESRPHVRASAPRSVGGRREVPDIAARRADVYGT